MQKITPFLWFDTQAEEAMKFYCSVFKNSKKGKIARFGDAGPGFEKGQVMTATFKLFSQEFIALNAGPRFKFNEAVSFVVNCESQKEVDHYWDKLTSGGGQPSRCGWLKDKFGLSWQIVPTILGKLASDKNVEKAGRVVQAMLKMDKIIIKDLQAAYRGK